MAELIVRHLGLVDYQPTLEAMRQLTAERNADTPDQIWLLQHPPVFTQGQAGKAEHVLAAGDIPVIQVERGEIGRASCREREKEAKAARRRHTRFSRDWSSDVCSSDLIWGWWTTSPRWKPCGSSLPSAMPTPRIRSGCCSIPRCSPRDRPARPSMYWPPGIYR